MRLTLVKILLILTFMFFGIFVIQKLHHFQNKTGFVILIDKVGDPSIMTTFRVDPNSQTDGDSSYCQVGGDKLYTPHNVSVFTAAQIGDVLRHYRYDSYYRILGKNFFQNCFEMYMPVKLVSLYPDMNYWPFRKDDLREGDPNYEHVIKLTKSQR